MSGNLTIVLCVAFVCLTVIICVLGYPIIDDYIDHRNEERKKENRNSFGN